jgi:hypothetical protein
MGAFQSVNELKIFSTRRIGTLKQLILQNNDRPSVLQALWHAIEAVEQLHLFGYTHRNITPSSFSVTTLENDNLILHDFNYARTVYDGSQNINLPDN